MNCTMKEKKYFDSRDYRKNRKIQLNSFPQFFLLPYTSSYWPLQRNLLVISWWSSRERAIGICYIHILSLTFFFSFSVFIARNNKVWVPISSLSASLLLSYNILLFLLEFLTVFLHPLYSYVSWLKDQSYRFSQEQTVPSGRLFVCQMHWNPLQPSNVWYLYSIHYNRLFLESRQNWPPSSQIRWTKTQRNGSKATRSWRDQWTCLSFLYWQEKREITGTHNYGIGLWNNDVCNFRSTSWETNISSSKIYIACYFWRFT